MSTKHLSLASLRLTFRHGTDIPHHNFMCVYGGHKGEQGVVKLRRQIPGQLRNVLRLRLFRGSGDDELAGHGCVAALDPELPIHVRLPESIMVAEDPVDRAWPDVDGRFDVLET